MKLAHRITKKLFYGWWLTIASTVLAGFGYGTWFYGYGNFFTPMRQEFGWSRAVTSTAVSLSRLEGGLEGPVVGPLIVKLGPRKLMLAGWLAAGAGFIMMGFVKSLWMLYVSYSLLLSLGLNTALYPPTQHAIINWFKKNRGKALAVLTTGAAIGPVILVPGVAWLIQYWGWRPAAFLLGFGALALGIPLSLVMKSHGPEHYGLRPDGEPAQGASGQPKPRSEEGENDTEEEWSLTGRQALKTWAFWMYGIAAIFTSAASMAVITHEIPFLIDMGVDPVMAGAIMGMMTLLSAPGRLGFGVLADYWKWDLKYLLAFAYVLQAVGLVFLAYARSLAGVWLFLAIYGPGLGAGVPVSAALRGQYFGRKHFATVTGFIAPVSHIGSIIGPIFAGWVFDVKGSYFLAFLIIAGAKVFGAMLLLTLRRPRRRASALAGQPQIAH